MSLKDFAIISKLGSFFLTKAKEHTQVFIKFKGMWMVKSMH